jgi:uncharacterized damage-inducible protein DinB
MTNREYCLVRRKAEQPAFLRVLKAVPGGQLDYRPEPKARRAGDLAWMLARSEAALITLLDTGSVEWKEEESPKSADAIVAAYERNAQAVNQRIEGLDEAGWEKKGQFIMDGKVAWEDSIGEFIWGFLLDAIHHRGQ